MSDSNLQNTVSRLESQLADLQQKFDILANERLLYNLIQDYAYLHDRCFGKTGTPEDDAKWESLFTPDGVSDLYPLGGRGQGCQIMLSNVRVTVESAAPTSAVAQAYAVVTVVPNGAAQTVTVKGQYSWKFRKAEGIWKLAIPEAIVQPPAITPIHAYSVSLQAVIPHDAAMNSIQFAFGCAGRF
ncbi:hypothetical protein FRC10_006342 [Ceratobasidium sp. 414]|nr:hypothetical protein FRC10_006342 [Ceratobasidium sp. 414]